MTFDDSEEAQSWHLKNILGRGEITCYVQFSIISQNVLQLSSAVASNVKTLLRLPATVSKNVIACLILIKNKQQIMGSILNPFPHTTILQQTTLNIFCQKLENLYNYMDNL